MVKQKRKYLLAELLFSGGSGSITDSEIYHEVLEQVAKLHGDYGVGCIKATFQVKVHDRSTNIIVLRIGAEACPMLCSALPFVVCIGSAGCTINLIFEGSTMRSLERRLIKRNLKELYALLRRASTPAEKARIRAAIASVTGSKVAHIRMSI